MFVLLCFKQYIFLLNNKLGEADMKDILLSLYSTITNTVTIPPPLLLITISDVLIYIASNCSFHDLSGMPCRACASF